jgi:hypothetical protein
MSLSFCSKFVMGLGHDPWKHSSNGPIRSADWAVMGLSAKWRAFRTPAFVAQAPLVKPLPLQTSKHA